jgi:hypothetical protein
MAKLCFVGGDLIGELGEQLDPSAKIMVFWQVSISNECMIQFQADFRAQRGDFRGIVPIEVG